MENKLNRPKIIEQFGKLQKEINDCSTPKCNNDCSFCENKVPLLQLMKYILELETIINSKNIPSNAFSVEYKKAKKQELINFSEFKEIVKISNLKKESLKQETIEKFIQAFNYWLKTIASSNNFNYEPQNITLKKLGDLIDFTFDRSYVNEVIKSINEKEPRFILSMVTEKKPDGKSFINLRFN